MVEFRGIAPPFFFFAPATDAKRKERSDFFFWSLLALFSALLLSFPLLHVTGDLKELKLEFKESIQTWNTRIYMYATVDSLTCSFGTYGSLPVCLFTRGGFFLPLLTTCDYQGLLRLLLSKEYLNSEL